MVAEGAGLSTIIAPLLAHLGMDDPVPERLPTQSGSHHSDDTRTELGTMDEGSRTPPVVRSPLGPSAVVGRYVIIAQRGAGSMGIVYAAYDPELDRKVALKVMPADDGDAERRREAMVLAKVNHPNVVTVHDVGAAQGWTWIAMELVEGQTLRERIASGPLPWTELVTLMIDAGRGLAAVHSAGLVHRDVKPDNIMIGTDGRVRMMDFGLAREHAGAKSVRGARAGSPAYMAPEQHAGQPTDPRTDVFGWSVTFFEALFGVRPFGGDSLGALVGAIASGRRRDMPPSIKAPRWLRDAIVRGLDPDPDRRWPSLDDAIARLHRGMVAGRRRKLLLVGAGLTALAATPSLLEERSDRLARRACDDGAAAIDAVWNDEARVAIRAALVTEAAGLRPSAADQTAEWFDGAARDWKSVYLDACTVALDRASTPDAIYACLDERRMSMASVVALLSEPEPGPFAFTPSFVVDALEVKGCAAQAGIPAPPTPTDEAVISGASDVRLQMLRAAAWTEIGDLDRAREVAMVAHQRAVSLGWPPLVAEAAARVGWVIDRGRAPSESPPWLERAALGALAGPDSELVIRLALGMARAQAERLGDTEAATLWLDVAEQRIDRLGLRDTLHDAMLSNIGASVARIARRFDDAIAADLRALRLRTAWLGEDHPLVAASWNNLAADYGSRFDDEDALAAATHGYELRKRAFGPGHPEVLTSAINVAALMSRLGEHDLSIELLDDEIGNALPTLGPDHPLIGAAWNNRGTSSYRDGDFFGAIDPMTTAVEIRTAAFEPDHHDIATVMTNLAAAHLRIDQCPEAMDFAARALAALERSRSPRPDEIGLVESLLAVILWTCHRSSRALELAEHAATRVPSDARDTQDIVYARLGMIVAEVDPIRGNALLQWVADRAPPGERLTVAGDWMARGFQR